MPSYRKKRFYKRKRASGKVKLMKKVAIGVVKRTLETKHNTGAIDSFINTSSSTGTYLITRYMYNGLTDDSMTGNKVSISQLKLRLMVRIPPSAGSQWSTQLRVLLVSTDREISWDQTVPNDFFLTGPAGYNITAPVNPKTYTVYMDKTYNLQPQTTTTDGFGQVVSVTKNFKKGLGINFRELAQSGINNYCKGKNYYFVIQAGGWSNTLANIQYKGTMYLKYKDV